MLREETYRIQCQPAPPPAKRQHEQTVLKKFWTHEYAAWVSKWDLPLKIEEDEQEEVRKAYLRVRWSAAAATPDMLFYKQHVRPDSVYNKAKYLTSNLSQVTQSSWPGFGSGTFPSE